MTAAGEYPVTTREDICALPLVRRTAALLDRDPQAYRDGGLLPRGWQFTLFTQETRQSELAEDGFTPLENDIPGFTVSRVMLGGRRIAYHRDLVIGEGVRQDSQIIAMARKEGRSGPLAIVTRRSTIYAAGSSQPAIVEDSDLVYRAGAASGGSAEPAAGGGEAEIGTPFLPTTAMLFRYSALSFNAHRIHYDAPYTTGVEGYPGLVVNGGLISLALVDWCQRFAGIEITRTDLRSVRPLHCGRPAVLKARRAEAGWQVWAENEEGLVAQQGVVA